MAKIVLCDDHLFMAEGLKGVLENLGHEVVAVLRNGRELVEYVQTHSLDLVIVDIGLPVLNGLDALVAIQEACPGLRCMVMTMHEDPERIARAFHNGAKAYVSKKVEFPEFAEALKTVLGGGTYLSKELGPEVARELSRISRSEAPYVRRRELTVREVEIVQLVTEGKSDKEIAAVLNMSMTNMRFYYNRIRRDLNLKTRIDVAKFGIRQGYVPL